MIGRVFLGRVTGYPTMTMKLCTIDWPIFPLRQFIQPRVFKEDPSFAEFAE